MITHGEPLTPDTPAAFGALGQGYVGFVPVPVIVLIAMAVFFSVIMRKGRFGRYVYATGGNEHAARISGVKTNQIKFAVYVLSGVISAVAGVISYSRHLSAELTAGLGAELDVIAAAAIGGASLAAVIANGVVLVNIDTYAQQATTGAVIIIAVSIDVLRNRMKGGRV